MPTYHVAIVKREYLNNWHEWNGKEEFSKMSKKTKKLGEAGALGQTFETKAKNKTEAERIAREKNPGYAVLTGHTEWLRGS